MTALREMMWHSDNARMHEIQAGFQRSGIDAFSRGIGLRSTTQPPIPGCQTAGARTNRWRIWLVCGRRSP